MVLQRTTKTAATIFYISDVLRDLVPFVQFKKCEKHPWRSVTLVKLQNFGLFFTVFKLCKWYQITQCITLID